MRFIDLAQRLGWHSSDVVGRRVWIPVAEHVLGDLTVGPFGDALYDPERDALPTAAEQLRERRYLTGLEMGWRRVLG
jgi:hypothetical protein